MQATNSASSFEVTTDGTGVVGHAGAALLRELADRLGLTRALDWHQAGAHRHPDAAVLSDRAVMLADGGQCLSDLAALRDQPELFGPVASTPTAWRVIERVAHDPDGLARLRAARAHARARAWATGDDTAVEVLIVDADATLAPRCVACPRRTRASDNHACSGRRRWPTSPTSIHPLTTSQMRRSSLRWLTLQLRPWGCPNAPPPPWSRRLASRPSVTWRRTGMCGGRRRS